MIVDMYLNSCMTAERKKAIFIFYEARIVNPNLFKTNLKVKTTKQFTHEYWGANDLNKILAYRVQWYFKSITHHDQVKLLEESKDGSLI